MGFEEMSLASLVDVIIPDDPGYVGQRPTLKVWRWDRTWYASAWGHQGQGSDLIEALVMLLWLVYPRVDDRRREGEY